MEEESLIPNFKFRKNQTVYYPTSTFSSECFTCPTCLGRLKCTVSYPNGESEEFPCQTCSGSGYDNRNPKGKIEVKSYHPEVLTLTIKGGRIGDSWGETTISYTCYETWHDTGGTIYPEDKLFNTYEEAYTQAVQDCEGRERNIAANNLTKKFGGRQKIIDFLSVLGYSKREKHKNLLQFVKWANLSGILTKEDRKKYEQPDIPTI